MFKKVLPLAAIVSVMLTGCNATDNDGAKVAKSNAEESDGLVCRMEKKTGSNRMTRVCFTAEEREQMEEASREGWLRLQRSSETGGGE